MIEEIPEESESITDGHTVVRVNFYDETGGYDAVQLDTQGILTLYLMRRPDTESDLAIAEYIEWEREGGHGVNEPETECVAKYRYRISTEVYGEIAEILNALPSYDDLHEAELAEAGWE